MQISDEMLGEMIYRALYQHQGGLWECVSPRHFWYDAASRLRAALSALSLPVQPVACENEAHDHPSHDWRLACLKCGVFCGTDLSTTPPVPPTKGPEDDLIAALERVKALVVGDRAPNWNSDMAVTQSRMRIADICDLALRSALTPSVQP